MPQSPVTIFKYHGTGNDFIIVDADSLPVDVRTLAPAICDRHRGVGADGVIVVETRRAELDDGFDARMTIFNRDGSRPEMCGNGIRCVARHLVERSAFSGEIRVATDAGERVCVVHPGDRWEVDVDMGAPQLSPPLDIGGLTLHPVDMGNPHAVTFDRASDETVDAMGRQLNGAGSPFERGVNVEFVALKDDNSLDVVVYERGVGRTQACGTGACAAAVAAWSTGNVVRGPVTVWLPGGPLVIRRVAENVWMRGDVEFVMQAELGTGWLRARTK